ncbi:MAG: cation diffusion facilitator family transporter [Halobacteriota archaeon]
MGEEDLRRAFDRAAWVNVAGNALKIAVEGGAGLAFGSVALLADASHSVADLAASAVVLVWGGRAYEEADESHPHGHERLEPLTALFVGASIALLGVYLLYESALGVVSEPEVVFSPVLVAALGFAVVSMASVYVYTVRVDRRVDSPALRALAKDCLNDIYTSGAAAIGVFGLGLGYPLLDPFAGGLVSIIVVHQGLTVGRENVGYLVGRAASQEKQDEIVDVVLSHPDVHGVHDFKAFYDGASLEVEMHVEIEDHHSLAEAHDIESEVAESVRDVDRVGDVHVHLDPRGIGDWKTG